MGSPRPRYSKEEFARRGDEIYERDILSTLDSGQQGQFVAIDIETGAYEVDADEMAAADRLFARVPDAQTLVATRRVPLHSALWSASSSATFLMSPPRHARVAQYCRLDQRRERLIAGCRLWLSLSRAALSPPIRRSWRPALWLKRR